jgi:hypothetical protein
MWTNRGEPVRGEKKKCRRVKATRHAEANSSSTGRVDSPERALKASLTVNPLASLRRGVGT